MKKKLQNMAWVGLIQISLHLLSLNVLGQEVKKIHLDFKSKATNLNEVKSLKKGSLYQLEISNINLNLYNVQVNHIDSSIASEVELPSLTSLPLEGIQKVMVGLSSSIESQSLLDSVKPNKGGQKKLLDSNSELNQKTKTDILNYLDSLKFLLHTELENAINNANTADSILNNLNTIIFSYFIGLDTIQILTGFKNGNEILEVYNRLNATKMSIKGLQTNTNEIKNLIEHLNTRYPLKPKDITLLNNDVLINQQKLALLASISLVNSVLNEWLEKLNKDTLDKFFIKLIHLYNQSYRSYSSPIFQHNGDISKIAISITPKMPEYGQSFMSNYQFPESKLLVGISSGFYYANKFINENYSLSETIVNDTSSLFQLIKENEDKEGEIGFTTLLHVGMHPLCKKTPWLGVNGSIGPAISFGPTPQVRLTIGGGFTLGEKKKLISINALWMFGYSQKISNVYNKIETFTKKPEQVTIPKLSESFGVSIGYIFKF